jgi:asparagine synthetase B (glutamine-hydrolysing)
MTDTPFRRAGAAALSLSWVAAYDRRPGRLHLVREDGTSPSISEGGRYKVVFSGRLESSGHGAGSDADLVRDAYLRGGEAALWDLRGRFALLLHDIERDCFLAVRDALGYHPLFFAEQDDRVLIATSQDQLLASGVSKEVDRALAAGWICRGSLDPRETFFIEIRRLLPGHWLRVSGTGLSMQRYWSPVTAQRPDVSDFDLVHGEFDGILRRSVAGCLDRGPAGIYLSGGIDSATIAAVATEASRERGLPDPVALSLRFADPESDESTAQRAVAEALGLPLVMVPLAEAFGTEGGVIKTLGTAAEVATPPEAPWNSAYDHLALQALDRGCHTILSGDWGELLRARRELAADLLRRLHLAALYAMCESERRYYQSSRWRTAHTLLWRSGMRVLIRQPAAAALRRMGASTVLERRRRRYLIQSIPGWVAPDLHVRRELAERWGSKLGEPGRRDSHRSALVNFLESPDSIVWMDDYHDAARRLGIEELEPFYDRDLLEFLFSIPPEHLFFGRRVKALAEASIRPRVPELGPNVLGLAWPDRTLESMLVRDGGRALEFLDGIPVLSDREIVAPNALVKALISGEYSARLEFQAAWRALALEAWLQCRVRPLQSGGTA